MLAIPGISKRSGIEIKRYDFSDAQSGKDICDRRIACMKSHMRRFLNEGNDINSASDMKKAIDSYGGVKGCRAAVLSVDTSKQNIFKHKWTGITSFNNFKFRKTGIRVWKAYNIGKGKLIKNRQLQEMAEKQGETKIITLEPFTHPEDDSGLLKKSTSKPEQSSKEDTATEPQDDMSHSSMSTKGFYCPETCCVKVFLSDDALQKHIDTGKHLYRLQKESAYDTVKQKWAMKCTTVGFNKESKDPASQGETKGTKAIPKTSKMGWALKRPASRTRFSKPIKDFLLKTFLTGEETGRKADPADVATQIKSMRSSDGKQKLFDKSQWLSAQQIKNYFSRLSVLNKGGKLLLPQSEEEEDEDAAMIEEALDRNALFECIREEVEL